MSCRTVLPLLLAALLASAACGTRTVRESVFDDRRTQVLLRSQTKGGEPVLRGFEHPVTIAPVRLVHILSAIDLRIEIEDEPQRAPAIPLESLYTIAEGVAAALAKADPNQEVVVLSIRRTRRFGIFDRNYLTSFVTYAKDDMLYVHFSRVDWEVLPQDGDDLPEPKVGKHVMEFRVLPYKAMTLVDLQSVAVAWQNPIFSKPTRTRLAPSGKVMRRTILMESDEEEPVEHHPPERVPERASPKTLRELADLEEARRRGEISETEYEMRRSEILAADPASR